MPTISRFYGLSIMMYYNDHAPPHFHAEYGEEEAVISINPVQVLRGSLPRRAQSLVFECAAQHQQEPLADRARCRAGQAPAPIAPLD